MCNQGYLANFRGGVRRPLLFTAWYSGLVSEPKKHHYLPVVYQRGFTDSVDDERLWLYDRKTQRLTRAHPRYICYEKELYTMDPDGRQDRQIESQWLGRVDGEGATAIRMLKEGRM